MGHVVHVLGPWPTWSVAKAANEKQNRHVKEQATLLTQKHSEEF